MRIIPLELIVQLAEAGIGSGALGAHAARGSPTAVSHGIASDGARDRDRHAEAAAHRYARGLEPFHSEDIDPEVAGRDSRVLAPADGAAREPAPLTGHRLLRSTVLVCQRDRGTGLPDRFGAGCAQICATA